MVTTTDYWEIFQVQIWLVKFVFVDQSDLKLDPTAKHFSFWPRLGSFTSLRALGVIINKIASALTVRVEVSKACQTKLMKKLAYFLENTSTAYFKYLSCEIISTFKLFQKSRDTALPCAPNSFQVFSKFLWNCRMTNLSDGTLSMWMIFKSVNSVID